MAWIQQVRRQIVPEPRPPCSRQRSRNGTRETIAGFKQRSRRARAIRQQGLQRQKSLSQRRLWKTEKYPASAPRKAHPLPRARDSVHGKRLTKSPLRLGHFQRSFRQREMGIVGRRDQPIRSICGSLNKCRGSETTGNRRPICFHFLLIAADYRRKL